MTRYIATAAVLLSLAGAPVLVGCDKTVSEHKDETKTPDGTTVKNESKTTQSPDGSTKTTTEHKVDK